jgi:hypothetical protein
MTGSTTCTNCGRMITVSGQDTGSKKVQQPVTCLCGTPNEVMWPMDAGWASVLFTPDTREG